MPESGEDVLCYHCNNVFPKDEFGLMCPRCGSDFTEIIEGSAEEHPVDDESRPSSPPFPPSFLPPHQSQRVSRSPRYEMRNPFLDHNPWADTPPDDEPQGFGNGPRISRRSYRSPDGRVTFTSTTFTTGMGGRHRSPASSEQYAAEPLLQTVGSIFQELAGAYNTQDRNIPSPDREDPWETPSATRGANLHEGLWPRDTDSPQPPTVPLASLNDIFDLLRTDTAGDGFDRPRGGGIHFMGTTGMSPMNPLSLLAGILGGGRIGDAVYSQEELDRVISQLVDQNMNQGAPPAAETAIQSLPKKIVDKEMLGVEGRAECSICMEAVELGSEVTELPCKHWFHGDCIEMWLKQHNTCPHCRRGIDQGENTPGTRTNPMVIPSSPPGPPQSPPRRRSSRYEPNRRYSSSTYRTHRQNSSGSSSIHSPNHATSHSHQAASAPPESRRESSSGNGPQPQPQSNSGGVTGWLRSRFGSS